MSQANPISPERFDAVLFDLVGVLTATAKVHARCWKKMFDEYFLPFIAEQTEMVERTIYHLDGPGAVRHLDSLLDLPHLDGIQWVPGAGAAPAVEWIPLLKRIQEAGKLVYVYCDKSHVQKLLSELKPEGLMLVAEGCESVDEAQQLLENVAKWSKRN